MAFFVSHPLTAVQIVVGAVLLLAGPLSMATDGKITPGRWKTTDTVLEMDNPLLPPEMVARRKEKPLVVEYCVKTDDLLELIVGKDGGGACDGVISTTGGRISGTRKCASAKAVRSMSGTYTATTIDTVRDVQMETPKGPAHTKTHVVSERIGECP